ncbi:MAG: hypothetical protein Q9162_004411 [Coniocarpon cinnabarinum]
MRRVSLACLQSRQYRSTARRQFDRQVQDVVQGDLGATLEAHRASNLKTRIRKINENPQFHGWRQVTDELHNSRQAARRRKDAARETHARYNPSLEPYDDAPENGARAEEEQEKLENAHSRSQAPSEKVKHLRENKEAKDISSALAYGDYIPPHWYADRSTFRPYAPSTILAEQITGEEKLEKLLRNLVRFLGLTDEEVAMRTQLVTAMTMQFQKPVKNVKFVQVEPIDVTLATPLSRFSLVLTQANSTAELHSKVLKDLNQRKLMRIKQHSLHMPSIQDVDISKSSGIHTIFLRHSLSDMPITITTKPASSSQMSLVKSWLDEYEILRPIYLIIKTALEVRGLSDPSTGGLDSYSLLCLLVYFLRLANISSHADSTSLGTTLCDVLDFYAHFNTRENCIALDPPSMFKKRGPHTTPSFAVRKVLEENELLYWQHEMSLVNTSKPWLLTLQDPNNMSVDLGQGCNRIMDIRMTFRVLSQRLRSWLSGTPQRQEEDPLPPFFGRMLGLVRDRRKQGLRWARLPGTRRVAVGPMKRTRFRRLTDAQVEAYQQHQEMEEQEVKG